jgi:aerobic-type carbon monoxide dehydrogenase small subunit (CoxS/CutS family)
VSTPETEVVILVEVNGRSVRQAVDVRTTAADFLRDTLGLRGTRVGCEHGVCGACTILLDGVSARSCILYAPQLAGRSVTTVEGLAPAVGELHPLQDAFMRNHALQCGFCTAGMLLTAYELLTESTGVGEADVRDAISGNICRCTGYQGIVAAILDADQAWER